MKGRLSAILVSLLLLSFSAKAQKSLSICEYWIDGGSKEKTGFNGDEVAFTIDASSLSEGLHTLYYRVKDSEGVYSQLQTWVFNKPGEGTSAEVEKSLTKCEYWIDDGSKEEADFIGEEMAFVIDANSLSEGLHTLYYRIMDSAGMYSHLHSWVFNKPGRDASGKNERVLATCEYWIDEGAKTEVEMNGEEVAFSIDAKELSKGNHTLYYRVKDNEGMYSQLQTWVFTRNEITAVEVRDPKIVGFKYWWNDHTDKVVSEVVESEGAEGVFEKQIIVPDYAKTGENNCSARLNYVFVDDVGHISPLEYVDVEYNSGIMPVSVIEADKTETTNSVSLTWHVTQGQVLDYNVYYSEDGQPFVLWLPNTKATAATFRGEVGKSYRFVVTVRDRYGKQESIKEEKITTVTFIK